MIFLLSAQIFNQNNQLSSYRKLGFNILGTYGEDFSTHLVYKIEHYCQYMSKPSKHIKSKKFLLTCIELTQVTHN